MSRSPRVRALAMAHARQLITLVMLPVASGMRSSASQGHLNLLDVLADIFETAGVTLERHCANLD